MFFRLKTVIVFALLLCCSLNSFGGGKYNRYVAPVEAVPYPKGAGTVYAKQVKQISGLIPKYQSIGASKAWSHSPSSFKGDFSAWAVENKSNWFFIGWTKNEPWQDDNTVFLSTEMGSSETPVSLISQGVKSYGLNTTYNNGKWSDTVDGRECVEWMNANKDSCTFCYGNFARVKVSTASTNAQVSCRPIVNWEGKTVSLTATPPEDEVFSYWECDGRFIKENPLTFTVADGNFGNYKAVFVHLSYPESGSYVLQNAGTEKYLSYAVDMLSPTADREKDYSPSFDIQVDNNGVITSLSSGNDELYSNRASLIAFAQEVLQELNVSADPSNFINKATALTFEPVEGGYRLFHAIPELTCGKNWEEVKSTALQLLDGTNSLDSNQKAFVMKCLNDGVEPGGSYYLEAAANGSAIHYISDATDNYSVWNLYEAENVNFGSTSGWARLKNVKTGNYASFVGDDFQVGYPADFSGIAAMKSHENALVDPGSIFFVRNSETQSDIYSQGYGLRYNNDYWLTISPVIEDNSAWIYVSVNDVQFQYLNDNENGLLTGSTSGTSANTHWSLEPITSASMDKFYFGAKCGAKFTDGEGKYYTTMYTYFPYQCMDGVKAYYAKEANVTDGVGEVICKEITSGKVPANTAVILECSGLTPKENRLVPLPSSYNSMNGELTCNSVTPITDNLLIGTYFNLNFNGHINREKYDPEKHLTFSISDEGSLGFYKWTGQYLTPAKAYLDLTKISAAANSFRLTLTSEEDGVEQVRPAVRMTPAGVYDLQGRKVAESLDDNLSLPKGIYIVNGKKIVIR